MSTQLLRRKITDLTPGQRLMAINRARQLHTGELKMPPLRCGVCHHGGLIQSEDEPRYGKCLACGRQTLITAAERVRKQEVQSIILDGPE